jgi:hypothetical protein
LSIRQENVDCGAIFELPNATNWQFHALFEGGHLRSVTTAITTHSDEDWSGRIDGNGVFAVVLHVANP